MLGRQKEKKDCARQRSLTERQNSSVNTWANVCACAGGETSTERPPPPPPPPRMQPGCRPSVHMEVKNLLRHRQRGRASSTRTSGRLIFSAFKNRRCIFIYFLIFLNYYWWFGGYINLNSVQPWRRWKAHLPKQAHLLQDTRHCSSNKGGEERKIPERRRSRFIYLMI